MPPKSKKRKVASAEQERSATSLVPFGSTRLGAREDVSNADKGLMRLSAQLKLEIFHYFLEIGPLTDVSAEGCPVLPEKYLERTDVLRALSQVCVAYRKEFLPLLWETFNACCAARVSSGANPKAFFKHVGDTVVRKCDGLSSTRNKALGTFIRTANLVLTRYQTETVLPKLSKHLQTLPNLHTIHVLHAHAQMTTFIKAGFEGIVLPSIRTVIIPGNGHEILRRCPNVTTVWCTYHPECSKLVTVIAKHCKCVEELRGFFGGENIMKRIVKAAPNLRVFEIWGSEEGLEHLVSFKKFNTLIIRTRPLEKPGQLSKCIEAVKSCFKGLPETKEKRHIRLFYQDQNAFDRYPHGQYKEVEFPLSGVI